MKKMPKQITEKQETDDKRMIELPEHRAMIYLPEDACEVTIKARVFMNGELINVEQTISMQEIREAFRKADDGYIDEDDRFVLTDEGKDYLEQLARN